MYKSDDIMNLIVDMEAIVGNCFHNKQKRGGFYFRYPVKYSYDDKNWVCRGKIPDEDIDILKTMRYEAGANQLYIGAALYELLEFLEERYNHTIDFSELEEEYRNGGFNGDIWSSFFGGR